MVATGWSFPRTGLEVSGEEPESFLLPSHFMRRKNEGEHLCLLGYLMFEGESERPDVEASF